MEWFSRIRGGPKKDGPESGAEEETLRVKKHDIVAKYAVAVALSLIHSEGRSGESEESEMASE